MDLHNDIPCRVNADLRALYDRDDAADALYAAAEKAVDAEPEVLLDDVSDAACRDILLEILCARGAARPSAARAAKLDDEFERLHLAAVERFVELERAS